MKDRRTNLAIGETTVQSPPGVSRVAVVIFSKSLPDVLCKFRSVPERNATEEVMCDVIVRDVVQEESSLPSNEWTIDSRSSTTQESPSVVAEMRHRWIGVVKVGEHDDPMIGPDVRDEVELDERGDGCVVGPKGKDGGP